jgi:hypothetical protein
MQVAAGQIVHDKAVTLFVLEGTIENAHDVRMVEALHLAGAALEALDPTMAVALLPVQDLDGDRAPCHPVKSLPDLGEPAAADALDEPVAVLDKLSTARCGAFACAFPTANADRRFTPRRYRARR